MDETGGSLYDKIPADIKVGMPTWVAEALQKVPAKMYPENKATEKLALEVLDCYLQHALRGGKDGMKEAMQVAVLFAAVVAALGTVIKGEGPDIEAAMKGATLAPGPKSFQ